MIMRDRRPFKWAMSRLCSYLISNVVLTCRGKTQGHWQHFAFHWLFRPSLWMATLHRSIHCTPRILDCIQHSMSQRHVAPARTVTHRSYPIVRATPANGQAPLWLSSLCCRTGFLGLVCDLLFFFCWSRLKYDFPSILQPASRLLVRLTHAYHSIICLRDTL
jgi:hypothetical protein